MDFCWLQFCDSHQEIGSKRSNYEKGSAKRPYESLFKVFCEDFKTWHCPWLTTEEFAVLIRLLWICKAIKFKGQTQLCISLDLFVYTLSQISGRTIG